MRAPTDGRVNPVRRELRVIESVAGCIWLAESAAGCIWLIDSAWRRPRR